MTPLFRLEHVSLAGPKRPRLSGVTLDITPGITVIVGPSGAGKTSLLNLLAGFERPDSGRVSFSGPPGNRLPLFWSPADGGLWPGVSLHDHIQLVLPGSPDKIVVQEWLRRFDLDAVAATRVEELSAGERSRLCVARALAADAAVLLLDEPLVHVDRARAPRYWNVIREVCQSTGTSLISSSHDPDLWRPHADRVIGLENGQVAFDCAPAEVPREFEHA